VGWKLHVSATPESAPDVLDRALPALFEEDAAFKVAARRSVVAELNEGEGGISQIGKFISVYPNDDVQAVRLAAALDAATEGLRGPRVSTDRALHSRSLVHYRYGVFVGTSDEVEPPWPTADPFVAGGVAEGPDRRPIGGRYVVVSTIHRSPGGSVLLAADVDTATPCVLKRAGRDSRVAPDGRDARDQLRHEASILERLAPDPRIPAVLALIEDRGDLYLGMELLAGRTLGSIVSGPCDEGRTLNWGRQLASILLTIHRAGLAYRDLNPGNVLVSEDDTLSLVDFELTYEQGSHGEVAGTASFCSPQQLAGSLASVADDVYGAGALLRFLATGGDLHAAAPRPRGSGLARVIATCVERNPKRRYPSMRELDSALAALQAEP
jgi:hypothetical protein